MFLFVGSFPKFFRLPRRVKRLLKHDRNLNIITEQKTNIHVLVPIHKLFSDTKGKSVVLVCLSKDWYSEKAVKKGEAVILVHREETVFGGVTVGSG